MSVTIKVTESVKRRQEGNDLYRKASAEGLAPVLKKSRLEGSMNCYTKALQTAYNDNDAAASAAKNYAKASGMLATSYLEDKDLKQAFHYYNEAFTHFNKSLVFGELSKSEEWKQDILESCRELYEEAVEYSSDLPRRNRLSILESLAGSFDRKMFYGDCYSEIAQICLKEAVTALSSKDFRSSLYSLKEMYRPIEIMKECGHVYLFQEAMVLEADYTMQMARTESLQALDSADAMIKDHLANSEDLNMDLVYTVIDKYRHAVVLTREIEIEVEAIALSRLGKLYDQVLKIQHRASTCFKKCIELAHALTPRVMTTEPWYKVATDTLLEYQKKTILYQESLKEEERQKYLKELEPEMKILNEARNSLFTKDVEFLLLVLEKFPPKVTVKIEEKGKLDKMQRCELKKVFQRIVVHYHPDRQHNSDIGMKWKILCGEITKMFTSIYEMYKG